MSEWSNWLILLVACITLVFLTMLHFSIRKERKEIEDLRKQIEINFPEVLERVRDDENRPR